MSRENTCTKSFLKMKIMSTSTGDIISKLHVQENEKKLNMENKINYSSIKRKVTHFFQMSSNFLYGK